MVPTLGSLTMLGAIILLLIAYLTWLAFQMRRRRAAAEDA